MDIGENSSTNQYLTFLLNNETYALPIEDIREVLTVPRLTHIPCMPDFMRGVMNLRGAVVPILDLKLKFGMGNTDITTSTVVIVIEISVDCDDSENSILRIGLFADSVKKVVTLMPDAVEPPPQFGMQVKTAFIRGMGRLGEDFTVILNIPEILSDDDIAEAGAFTEELQEAGVAAQANE